MTLFDEWKGQAYNEVSDVEYQEFWDAYLPKEQKNYEYILEHKDETIEGSVQQLAEKFDMDTVTFVGFLDGLNTSLTKEIDLASLTAESNIVLSVDFGKLYYNMLDAQANWLYSLPQWDGILSVAKRTEIKKEYNKTRTVVKPKKIGRNDPCPCGSGKKYKKCCGKNI